MCHGSNLVVLNNTLDNWEYGIRKDKFIWAVTIVRYNVQEQSEMLFTHEREKGNSRAAEILYLQTYLDRR